MEETSVISLDSVDDVVAEIERLVALLPEIPEDLKVQNDKYLIDREEKEKKARIEAIPNLYCKGQNVPEELFKVLVEINKNVIDHQSTVKKRELWNTVHLAELHKRITDLLLKASRCIAPSTVSSSNLSPSSSSVTSSSTFRYTDKRIISVPKSSGGDSHVQTETSLISDRMGTVSSKNSSEVQTQDSTLVPDTNAVQDGHKQSYTKHASRLIEVSSKQGTLDIYGKVQDEVSRPPAFSMTLDLSGNQLVVLTSTVGRLTSLTNLDLYNKVIQELPKDWKLYNLVVLDLSASQLRYVPEAIGKLLHLKELHLSSNQLSELPESIGQCSSLRELHADYNKLKALPESLGMIESLEILTVSHNKIKHLPSNMASLVKLRELDVSGCELESRVKVLLPHLRN